MRTEPTVFWTAVGTLVFAVVTFATNAGFIVLTPEQLDAVNKAIAAIILVVTTVIIRSQVTPVDK